MKNIEAFESQTEVIKNLRNWLKTEKVRV